MSEIIKSNAKDHKEINILTVDVGSTSIKCIIYDVNVQVRGYEEDMLEIEHPKPGWCEIDPDLLWDTFTSVVNKTLKNSGIPASKITCMALSVHRGTFITWSKTTGKPYHRFIMWNDVRADEEIKKWNSSFALRSLRLSCKILHKITKQRRLMSASIYKLNNNMILSKLYWVLQNNLELNHGIENDDALFGSLETWLIWKLSGQTKHVTEYSCASATGMFDPYVMEYGDWCLKLFGIPRSILPELIDSCGFICETGRNIFGSPIKLCGVLGDQQAAMFGQCCFNKGDVNLTMGTGTFLCINTGNKPHASLNGIHPLVAWKIGDDTVFMAEGLSCDTASVINWANNIGLFDDPAETADLASSVSDSQGLYFVPAFSGIQAPVNDAKAGCGFVGISPVTTKKHMIRAILDSIAFRAKQMFECVLEEVDYDLSQIRVDGGVSNNDFIMQLVSDLTCTVLERPAHSQMGCLGVAFMAGLNEGIWPNEKELKKLWKLEKVFEPGDSWTHYRTTFYNWERALRRLGHWHKNGLR